MASQIKPSGRTVVPTLVPLDGYVGVAAWVDTHPMPGPPGAPVSRATAHQPMPCEAASECMLTARLSAAHFANIRQPSPLFSQDFLRVYMMDGTFTTMPLTETTKTRDVVKFMCKKHTLNNESEFGLLELWDHPGINGNMSERKLPNDELLLDQTMLTWEQAARKRFGIVNTVPHTAFKLVMRKLSSLLPQADFSTEQLDEKALATLATVRRRPHAPRAQVASPNVPDLRFPRSARSSGSTS